MEFWQFHDKIANLLKKKKELGIIYSFLERMEEEL